MKKIDTTYWKAFRVGDLFKAERGCVKKLQTLEKGSTPVIAAARSRQGVAGFYSVDAPYCDKITISCNGVGCGSTFYHDYPFNVNGDALVLTEKVEVSKEAKIYLACIFDVYFSRKYSYAEKCSPQKAIEEKILLPATPAGEPDWQYMEDYICDVEKHVQSSISALNTARYVRLKIGHSYWKEFIVGNIFQISRPSARVATEFENGDTPFVASGNENNGVEKYVNAKDISLDKKGCITVSPVDGSCFYQPVDFIGRGGAGSSIILLRNDKLMSYNALYICSVLSRVCSKYNYSNMGSASSIKSEKILLPATPAGEPDWHYMEMYMRGVEAMVKEKLSVLIPHKPEVTINDAAVVNFNGANVTYIDNSKTFNVEK